MNQPGLKDKAGLFAKMESAHFETRLQKVTS